MKGCDLCCRAARMHCESDQANLCWVCDAKVHGANFLVARHSRCLLCRSCQAPTPWRASGSRLGPTISVCERCAAGGGGCDAVKGGRGGGGGGGGEVAEEEVGNQEDQVIPPPPVASCSSSEESSSLSSRVVIRNGNLKRMQENTDLSSSQGDFGCSPSQRAAAAAALPARRTEEGGEEEEKGTSFRGSFRPRKNRKKAESPKPSSRAPAVALPAWRTEEGGREEEEEEEEATSFCGSFRTRKDRKKAVIPRPSPAQLAARSSGRHRRALGSRGGSPDLYLVSSSSCSPRSE